MKVALITDIHWGVRNDAPQFIDFYEKFYNEVFFPNLEKNAIKEVIILGDVFDRRKYINFNTLNRAKEIFFDRLDKDGYKVHIIVGNHDTYFKNTNEVNSINLLLSVYKNIVVVDAPEDYTFYGKKVCMIPWICPDNYQACMDTINNSKATICMGHFEIVGFQMYRGLKCEDGLTRSTFRKFNYTFSGHYHYKSDEDSIHYLGNPYGLNWQDYGDDRGFHLFDFETETLEFIKNPFSIFYRIVYDDKDGEIPEIIDDYANSYLKLVVVNKKNPYLFDKFVSDLYKISPADLTIIEDYTDIINAMGDDEVDQTEDTLTILNKFVDVIEENKIDNNKLKSILHELYIEALSIE